MKIQIALLITILLLTGCGNKQKNEAPVNTELEPTIIVGIGKVVPQGGIVNLAAPTSGIVKEIYVNSGDSLSSGDLILTLLGKDEELSVNEANSRLKTQELTVQSAKIALEKERIAHEEQKRVLNDAKELLLVGATTGENVRTLQNEYNLGTEQLKGIENEYKLQQSQLNELRVQRDSRANDLNKTEFKAPTDGVLLDLTPRVGEAVNLHQQYGRMSPNRPLVVMVEIDELFADKVKVGQECQINFHGDTEKAATGEIARISPDLKKKSLFSDSGTDLEDRRIREIEVHLNDIFKTLFIESKVECSIQLN
ncbi:MAG TPA: HlyD family efflux transporter periplasmic adaptor subunit [Fermentimonas sp.]|nr:HlyD family efflux transporter periplasmic adaptor subunit [Fermentimonas sp.]